MYLVVSAAHEMFIWENFEIVLNKKKYLSILKIF